MSAFIGRYRTTKEIPIGDESDLIEVEVEIEADLFCYGADDGITPENVTARMDGCELSEDLVEKLHLGDHAAEEFFEGAYCVGTVKKGVHKNARGAKIEVLAVCKVPGECFWVVVVRRHLPLPLTTEPIELMTLDQFMLPYQEEPEPHIYVPVEEDAPAAKPKEGEWRPMKT
jgi:hypothetical protein